MAEASFNNSEVCQHFLQNRCRFGNKCRFSHPTTLSRDGNEICSFYLRGQCRFGDLCWNRHVSFDAVPRTSSSGYSAARIRSSVVEPQHQRPRGRPDSRRRKEEVRRASAAYPPVPPLCTDSSSDSTSSSCDRVYGGVCRKPCLNPLDAAQREQHAAGHDAEEGDDSEKTCGICLEAVWEKPDPALRKFGLLEECDHVFCFACIMRWRKERGTGVACPECRTPSHFVTPSRRWFASRDEKKRLIADHRARLLMRHCKPFRRGEGRCPRGSLCPRLHMLRNGQTVTLPPPADHEEDFFTGLLMEVWDRGDSIFDELFSSSSDSLEDSLDVLYRLNHLYNFDLELQAIFNSP